MAATRNFQPRLAAARQQDVPPRRRQRQSRGFAEAGRGPGNEHPGFGAVRSLVHFEGRLCWSDFLPLYI